MLLSALVHLPPELALGLARVLLLLEPFELPQLLGGPLVDEEARVAVLVAAPVAVAEHGVDLGKVRQPLDVLGVVALLEGRRRVDLLLREGPRRVALEVVQVVLVDARDLGLNERQGLADRRRAVGDLGDARLDRRRLREELVEDLRRVDPAREAS